MPSTTDTQQRRRAQAGGDGTASLNATYGSIGGILIFLVWLWLANVAILLGAELDAEIERTRAIEAGLRPPDKTPFLPTRDGKP